MNKYILLDINNLLRIEPVNNLDYIIALREKLYDTINELQSFKDIIENETSQIDPDASDLSQLIKELNDEISDLKIDMDNLRFAIKDVLERY